MWVLAPALASAASQNGRGDAELFSGLLAAENATEVYMPESSFRVGGWNSDWGNLKLMELAADGKVVKRQDVIARFEFRATEAKQWLSRKLQEAEAEAADSKLAGQQKLEGLEVEIRRRELEARLAALQLEKAPTLSRRQAELDRIAKRIADFEVDVAKQRLQASRRSVHAERVYREEVVKRAKQSMGRYDFYEGRMTLRAPHDGTVRHAFNPRERRKVQKGDALNSGMRVCSVAKGAELSARFFVPEHRLAELALGSLVTVVTVGAAHELKGVVKHVDLFPQELGFLLEDPSLPNAREKAFAVSASLEDVPAAVSAGTEVRVKPAGAPEPKLENR
jgi:multidrug efflux pump subunit AcrA (membrane-fusion protein)